MMQFITMLCSLIISFLFLQMKHPLAMGMTLLVQTFLICLITGSMHKTFWFSYVLFLIFIGGMLVLFIYVTSLASNEMFSLSTKSLIFSLFLITNFILMIMFIDLSTITTFLSNTEMSSIFNMNNFINENTISLNKLYNFPTNIITLMLINYLFLTLIIIVKITNNFYGPLRNKN